MVLSREWEGEGGGREERGGRSEGEGGRMKGGKGRREGKDCTIGHGLVTSEGERESYCR